MPFFMKPVETEQLYFYYQKASSVFIDTRNPIEKGLFFALSGPRFNANTFALKALELGAVAAVVDDKITAAKDNRLLWVEDSLAALQKLARHHRQQLSTKIVGLTGSNGKTTTKELMAAVLQTHFKTSATKGNLNNHIGVPLSLLNISPDTEIAVIEMGANHQGEIAALCEIALPDIGYITNFGKAHMEGFGGVEGIIKGKTELYRFLKTNKGIVLCNTDDAKQMEHTKELTRFTFGSAITSDYKIEYATTNPLTLLTSKGIISSNLYGSYNLSNIAAAAALGTYYSIPFEKIQKGIAAYQATQNRSEIRKVGSHQVILDAYNANPTSMKHALTTFFNQFQNQRVLILGDMLELGSYSTTEHQQIVDFIEQQNDCLSFLIGEAFAQTQSSASQIHFFNSIEELKVRLIQTPLAEKNILIKGSRGLALERILPALSE